jgi:hypothetical protein
MLDPAAVEAEIQVERNKTIATLGTKNVAQRLLIFIPTSRSDDVVQGR